MQTPPMYHDGMRHFQDQFGTRELADRLEQVTHGESIEPPQKKLIERSAFFFLATTDAEGWPDCSYKGGEPGFVRVVDEQTLVFPSYDGNGMYRSLGNIHANPKVGLLFIDLERPKRLRVNGVATVLADSPLMGEFVGAELLVSVTVAHVFPNCPRYIHQWQLLESSAYVPVADHPALVPDWKYREDIFDALPADDPARKRDPD
jgi:uncharacterized protein